MGQGIIRVLVLFAIGAMLYNAIRNPKGTAALADGVTGLLDVGLGHSSGLRGGGGGGGRRRRRS